MHTYIHTYIHIYIHICWFSFDALAQGNAYEPTKEPINHRGPGGDRTHDLQTEATPPAASCPARTRHVTEIASKNATPMTYPRLHWTIDNPSGMHRCQCQHLCVLILNCALALAIYIFVGLVLMLWHRKRIWTHKGTDKSSWTRRGSNSRHTHTHNTHTHTYEWQKKYLGNIFISMNKWVKSLIENVQTVTSGWLINRNAGDLRCHRAHCYVNVMIFLVQAITHSL